MTNTLTLTPTDHAQLLEALIPIVRRAGEVVMRIYEGAFDVQTKADQSPVTQADQQAEDLITHALQALAPDIPVVGEEAASAGLVTEGASRFWLVDPLDGTKEFINRNNEFTVNIALVENGRAVLGVVLAPALGELYAGGIQTGSFMEADGQRQRIVCCKAPAAGLRVVASRSHGDAAALAAFLAGHKVSEVVNSGSSLKLCLLAKGFADVYPRLGRTMEWDIAAGHAVLSGSGGIVEELDGSPFLYNKPGFENPHFVAWGLR